MNKQLSNDSIWVYEISFYKKDPKIIIAKIMEVVEKTSIKSSSSWPSDDEWSTILPKWFTTSFVKLTQEEARALMKSTPKDEWHKLPWHFSSWLDAVQSKGWEWHSYELTADLIKLNLIIRDWPASLEAFEWIVKTAGGNVIKGDFIKR